jgi:hypothetical protein
MFGDKSNYSNHTNPRFSLNQPQKEAVNNPSHYGGKDNPYEAIKVIRAWDLGFSLGNTVKYISRAGKKDPAKRLEDLKKALWYLQEEIDNESKGSNR